MKKNLENTICFLLLLIALDLFILLAAVAQLKVEGRTGQWNGFWRWQAEHILGEKVP